MVHWEHSNQKKGFTIIELLVVISIISVLSGIVITRTSDYKNKAKNAVVKTNINLLLKNSVDYLVQNGGYTGFPSDTSVGCFSSLGNNIRSQIPKFCNGPGVPCQQQGPLTCSINDSGSNICFCVKLNTTSTVVANTTYCVDSTGVKKESQTTCDEECYTSDGDPTAGFCQ